MPRPCAIPIFRSKSPTFTVAARTPSKPLSSSKSTLPRLSPVTFSYAVRTAASITPPVVPKITAAPVDSPNGLSNSASSKLSKSILACLISAASSLVESVISTSFSNSGLSASYFLARHGIIETTIIFSLGIFIFSAK